MSRQKRVTRVFVFEGDEEAVDEAMRRSQFVHEGEARMFSIRRPGAVASIECRSTLKDMTVETKDLESVDPNWLFQPLDASGTREEFLSEERKRPLVGGDR